MGKDEPEAKRRIMKMRVFNGRKVFQERDRKKKKKEIKVKERENNQ